MGHALGFEPALHGRRPRSQLGFGPSYPSCGGARPLLNRMAPAPLADLGEELADSGKNLADSGKKVADLGLEMGGSGMQIGLTLARCGEPGFAAPADAQEEGKCRNCAEGWYNDPEKPKVRAHWWVGAWMCQPGGGGGEILFLMEPGCKICESPHCDDPTVPHDGNCPDEECDDGVPHMMMALAAGSDVRSVMEAGARYPGRLLLLPDRRAVGVVDCEGWIVALRHFPDVYHWSSALRVG